MMKKMIGIAVVLGVVATTWALVPPTTDAAGCIRCMFGGVTPPAWGMGSTCQQAINNAINNAEALIPGSCDVCQTTPIEVTACKFQGGQWRADYKIRYKCYENLCY